MRLKTEPLIFRLAGDYLIPPQVIHPMFYRRLVNVANNCQTFEMLINAYRRSSVYNETHGKYDLRLLKQLGLYMHLLYISILYIPVHVSLPNLLSISVLKLYHSTCDILSFLGRHFLPAATTITGFKYSLHCCLCSPHQDF